MARGTVKWFNPTKGYGFIQPQEGGRDVFVHVSAVERAGLSTLNEGQHIEYEVEENRGKTSAVNLKVKYLPRDRVSASAISARRIPATTTNGAPSRSNGTPNNVQWRQEPPGEAPAPSTARRPPRRR
jgi:cold shock protein